MTKEEAEQLGYRIVAASSYEAGLIKGEKGIRTWWASDFDCKLPELDHPKVMEAIRINEDYEHSRPT